MTGRKLIAAAAAVLALLAPTGGVRAEVVPSLPQPAANVVLTGTLEYVTNLETPHYELDGWAVIAPDQSVLVLLDGKAVTISGRPYDGISILMRRQVAVSRLTTVLEGQLQAVDGHYELEGWTVSGLEAEIQAFVGTDVRLVGSVVWRTKGPPTIAALGLMPLPRPAVRRLQGPLLQAADLTFRVDDWVLEFAHPGWLTSLAGRNVTVTGQPVLGADRPTLKVTDLQVSLTGIATRVTTLEAPHWELNGFVLTGLTGDLFAYADRPVTLQAALSQELSVFMKPVLNVLQVAAPDVPSRLVVTGMTPNLPTLPAFKEGYLMLPLRAVIEAAGGHVAWDPALYAVRISIGEQSATIRIGSRSTDGAKPLAVAPYLQAGSTMAPLELFERLGLHATWGESALYLEQNP